MSFYGGTQYGGGPVHPSQIPAEQVRPRRVWYVVAAVVALVLAGAGVVTIVTTVKGAADSVSLDRFPSGSSHTVGLTGGETKAIYVSQAARGQVNCRSPQMSPGALTQPDSTFRFTVNSRSWERVFEVKPDRTGEYTLICTSAQQAEFAVGDKPEVGSFVGRVFATIALFFAAVGAAAAISIVTAVRRSRHRRRLAAAAAPAWGSPPPQWGPPPPK